jgi:hypothetical protein
MDTIGSPDDASDSVEEPPAEVLRVAVIAGAGCAQLVAVFAAGLVP